MAEADFEIIYQKLRNIYKPYFDQVHVKSDGPGHLYLNTKKKNDKGQDIYFGAAQIKKNYVSFYFMPVYVYPELLNSISPELKKRMQGKSCFNFKKDQPELFKELEELVKEGTEAYRKGGWM